MFTCNCFSRTFLYRQSRTLLGRLESLNLSHTVAVQLNARSPTSYYTTASKLRGLQHAQSLLLKNVQSCRTLKTSFFLFDEYQIVHTPPFAESVTEGDVRWEKGIGDTVAVDEVIGEIETDKTALPIVSPAAGVIEELYVADGEKVEKGNKLFKLRVAAGSAKVAASPKADIPPKQEVAAKPPPPSKLASPPSASPPQKPVAAAELSVSGPPPKHPPKVSPPPAQPMAVIKPSPPPPPKTAASPASVPSASSAPPAAAGASLVNQVVESKDAPTRVMGNRVEIKVKMNRMRQRIAQRLKDAQNVNAMLTTFNEVDMSKLMEMRNKYKDLFQKSHGVKLGFMSAFVKASSNALQQMPVVNAVIEDNFVVYRDFVDISVAVATPKGLVVPVLRNVHQMNFGQIELGMAELGEKARSGELAIEDMDGGTFTISNGGVFGSLMGTPIINPPQSAILGMHGIFDRPIAVDKKVEIRPMMYVALTYDHRLIDGREAVTFLRKVKQFVEDPQAMLLDV